MRRTKSAFAVCLGLILLLCAPRAHAQTPGIQYLCIYNGLRCDNSNSNLVSATNPLPTTATISGSVTANSAATASSFGSPPTLTAGTGRALSETLTGGLRVQLNIQGTDIGLGQQTMAASVPVVIASNQSNLGTNLAQVAGASVATGHGTASGALRVELPTDGTGVVNDIINVVITAPSGTVNQAYVCPVFTHSVN